jgi:hypothetical protein
VQNVGLVGAPSLLELPLSVAGCGGYTSTM